MEGDVLTAFVGCMIWHASEVLCCSSKRASAAWVCSMRRGIPAQATCERVARAWKGGQAADAVHACVPCAQA